MVRCVMCQSPTFFVAWGTGVVPNYGRATQRMGHPSDVLTFLFRHKEAGVGSALSDAERHCGHASRAGSAVRRAVAISVDTRVDAAAVEVDADPGPISERRRAEAPIAVFLKSLDVKMVRRLTHDSFYRRRGTDKPTTNRPAVAASPCIVSRPRRGQLHAVAISPVRATSP